MYRIHGEGWQAHGNVLRSAFFWSRITDPFAGMRDHSLSGANLQGAAFVFHPQHSLEHDRELIELRSLAGLNPSTWATLVDDVLELTRPMYSSMSLGLFPAASMRVGWEMRVGIKSGS